MQTHLLRISLNMPQPIFQSLQSGELRGCDVERVLTDKERQELLIEITSKRSSLRFRNVIADLDLALNGEPVVAWRGVLKLRFDAVSAVSGYYLNATACLAHTSVQSIALTADFSSAGELKHCLAHRMQTVQSGGERPFGTETLELREIDPIIDKIVIGVRNAQERGSGLGF
jgi:hypothetical protein